MLVGYSDSDYANCPSSSKSIGGYCFTLGSGVISWASRKQKTVANSSCYAEYIALHEASHEIVFLRELMPHLLHPITSPTTLYCDNNAASQLAEDHVWHAHVKHIRVKYHYIRELVANSELSVARVRSSENTADILTKALNRTPVTAKGCSQPLLLPPRIEMSAMSEALSVTAACGFATANAHSAAVVQVEVLACVKVPAAINTWGSW
jgi:hypothetical protein